MTNKTSNYPIGTPGKKWGESERAQWLAMQSVKRSYADDVISKIEALSSRFNVAQYGALPVDEARYPLFVIKSKNWQDNRQTILVTGGVHGYETSGVMGAIRFADTKLEDYSDNFNVIVAPCLSPWGYETINRWNSEAVDPNRSFYEPCLAPESQLIKAYLASLEVDIIAHIDLHETTDTDNSEFRPALSARDAIEQKTWNIPDGFYTVGNTENPVPEFQKAVIDSVAKVTHIALSDDQNELIGVPMEQFGVINYAAKKLGLCMGLTDAKYVTTTEVYPDSPKVDDENCVLAQVAAITGGLNYIVQQLASEK